MVTIYDIWLCACIMHVIHMYIQTYTCPYTHAYVHTHKSLISPLNSMYRAPANCQALLCALRNLTTDKVASFFYAAPLVKEADSL